MDNETVPDRLQGRWRACAAKVHVLIRGDLCRVPVSRACPKGGAAGGNPEPCAQKSAEAVVPTLQGQLETGRAEGHEQARITRVSRCRTLTGANRRMVVNHPRRRTRSNGLGRVFGSRSNTRAQPPSADPHAVVVWEGPRSNPGPYPDSVRRIFGSSRIGYVKSRVAIAACR